jgi:hypothetical protein
VPRYAIGLAPAADRDPRRLSVPIQRRTAAEIEKLADDPRPAGVIKPAGDENLWRGRFSFVRADTVRVGNGAHDSVGAKARRWSAPSVQLPTTLA